MHSVWGSAAALANLIAILSMLPFVAIEINTMIEYRLAWFSSWNLIDAASYIIQAGSISSVLHHGCKKNPVGGERSKDSWMNLTLRFLYPFEQPYRAAASAVVWKTMVPVFLGELLFSYSPS